jgi:hypothetical protein
LLPCGYDNQRVRFRVRAKVRVRVKVRARVRFIDSTTIDNIKEWENA